MMLAGSPDPLSRLPATLPIFPLAGALLLPFGNLPLHIFEPRYLNLVEEALASGRIFGMVQPRDAEEHPIPDMAAVYNVGCAGRIVSFAETDDGRYLITLRGLCRFRIIGELPLKAGFRRISADYAPFESDLFEPSTSGIDRNRLIESARAYLRQKNMMVDWSAAEGASDLALLTSLAMVCPFDPGEKQALLECQSVAERGKMLISLLEMAVHDPDASPAAVRH
jgi:hypothetical protein